MSEEELQWMKRIGAAVREHHRQPWLARLVSDLTS
jgi:hypothetical protein